MQLCDLIGLTDAIEDLHKHACKSIANCKNTIGMLCSCKEQAHERVGICINMYACVLCGRFGRTR